MSQHSRSLQKRRLYLAAGSGVLLMTLLLAMLGMRQSGEAVVVERSRTYEEGTDRPGARTAWSDLVPLQPPSRDPQLVDASHPYFSDGMAAYRKGDYGTSSISFRQATEALPENPELRMYLGSSLLMTRDYDVAEKELRVAAQLAHGDQRNLAQLLLSKAQLERGDQATARETLAQVAAGGGVWADKARSLLTEIPGMP